MEPRKIELSKLSIEALRRALIGVKSPREEAFVLLTAIPEPYLPELVEYLQVLVGLKNHDG